MKGAWTVGSSVPGTATGGAPIVKLVQKTPGPDTVGAAHFAAVAAGVPTRGRWVSGQSGSTPTLGSTRGMHMGNPVMDAIVGLSWSTVNRASGVKATV